MVKEQNLVSTIVILAIVLIVGVVLFQVVAQEVGKSTNTVAVANASLGTLTNGTTLYITDYKSCSDFKVWNATGDEEVASSNYTATNNVVYNGQEAISVEPKVTADYASAWNVGTATYQGTCQPLGYISNSGGRAMAGLIIIMFALAIAIVALSPTLRSGLSDMFS